MKVFGESDIIAASRHKLHYLKQTKSASSYAAKFQRYAAYLHWGDEALCHAFFDGLKEDVKDKILSPNDMMDISELISAAIKWDNLSAYHYPSCEPR